jgi:large subunit ribosomal protein L29
MKPQEVREMSDSELGTREHELVDELFHLRLRRATSQLPNPMKMRVSKRDLARVKTELRARALRGGVPTTSRSPAPAPARAEVAAPESAKPARGRAKAAPRGAARKAAAPKAKKPASSKGKKSR